MVAFTEATVLRWQAYANQWVESMRFTNRNIVKRKNAAVLNACKAFTLTSSWHSSRNTMAIGTWDPDQHAPQDNNLLTEAFLERAVAASADNKLEQLEQVLDATEQRSYSALMRYTQEQWFSAVDTLSSDSIYHLMRFLTVAEMAFSGWEAGASSPVIWLNTLLKNRGEPLQKDQVLWIKSHTRNRYLPNGAVL